MWVCYLHVSESEWQQHHEEGDGEYPTQHSDVTRSHQVQHSAQREVAQYYPVVRTCVCVWVNAGEYFVVTVCYIIACWWLSLLCHIELLPPCFISNCIIIVSHYNRIIMNNAVVLYHNNHAVYITIKLDVSYKHNNAMSYNIPANWFVLRRTEGKHLSDASCFISPTTPTYAVSTPPASTKKE